MRIEPSPPQAAGNLHRKDENRFIVRLLTPPQAAGSALAITVQFVHVVALLVLIFSPVVIKTWSSTLRKLGLDSGVALYPAVRLLETGIELDGSDLSADRNGGVRIPRRIACNGDAGVGILIVL